MKLKELKFEPVKVLYNTRNDGTLRAGRRTIWGDLAPESEVWTRAEQECVPYTYGLFIQSKDGRATDSLDGGVGRMAGAPADRFGQFELRAAVDAFLVGAGTLRADRTTGAPAEKELLERRKKEKGNVAPLNVFFSASGNFPPDAPVFHDPDVETLLFVTDRAASRADELQLLTPEVVVVSWKEPLREIWNHLYRRGITTLGFEGGPRLMGMALERRLVHELLLTHSPLLLGGKGVSFADAREPLTGISTRPLFLGLEESSGLLFERSRVLYG